MQGLLAWMVAPGDTDPAGIRARVFARPSRVEALVVGSIALILVLSSGYSGSGIDWEIFAGAADGEFVSDRGLGFYYPYWLLPIFDLYALAGLAIGGLLWSLTNVAGVWFAARVWGARPAVVLAGFGAISGFYTGTITGVAVAALAGMYWAGHERRWTLVGALSLLAMAKPQWGLPLGALIVWQVRPAWTDLVAWVRLVTVPLPIAVASFAAFGWWPAEVLDRANALPPEGNGSLWHFVGPVVLVLWMPVLVLPMEHRRRLSLVAATAMLAVPYVQQYDFTVLWILTADGLGLISHSSGVLDTLLGEQPALAIQTLAPLAAYGILVREPLAAARARRAGRNLPTGPEQPGLA